MSVKKLRDIPQEKIPAGKNTSRQILIGADEGPNFAMRRFILGPGGSMPAHTNSVEHEQFVLGGRAEIAIGDKRYKVEQNDIVFIPAGIPHWYRTLGDTPFEFLCLIPNAPVDEITLVEEEK